MRVPTAILFGILKLTPGAVQDALCFAPAFLRDRSR